MSPKRPSARSRLARREFVQHMVPGAVFIVPNEAIGFPEERAPNAGEPAEHKGRRVIIVQATSLNRQGEPITVLVVPCTASKSAAGRGQIEVPPEEACFTAETVVALVTHLQPVLKGDLIKHIGPVSESFLASLRNAILQALELRQERRVELPPREPA